MGTDIHPIVQVRDNINSPWRKNTEKIFPNHWYLSYRQIQAGRAVKGEEPAEIPKYAQEEFTDHPDSGRNYDWFAVLADVRNGSGFAGVTTGDGFAVIAEPRGFPVDYIPAMITHEWDENTPAEGTLHEEQLGDHSHSYLHYSDFEKFDWNQVTMKQGIITLDEYKILQGTVNPPSGSYSGWISGPGIKVVTQEDADYILANPSPNNKATHVLYRWPVVYQEYFQHKFETWIKPLKQLADQYGDENVRVVFGFDS